MYCNQCGAELPDTAKACSVCGAIIAPAAGAAVTPGAGARHDSFEYARTTVKRDLATVATDTYESLGFELTGARNSSTGDATVLAFRRSRKVRGKAQLAKLQRTADDLLDQLASLEAEKTKRARMVALSMGIVSALVLGIGMCCTMVWQSLFALGIVVGIVGIAGCIATVFAYQSNVKKDTERVAPHIEAAYDSIATICEEAQTVLAGA